MALGFAPSGEGQSHSYALEGGDLGSDCFVNSLSASPQFQLQSLSRGTWYHQFLNLCEILSIILIGSLSQFSTFSLLDFPEQLALEFLLFIF